MRTSFVDHRHIPNVVEREYQQAYFTPADLKIGAQLVLYGRKFLIYDVDNFTKAWYYQNFGVTDFEPVPVKGEAARLPKMVRACLSEHTV